MGFFKREYINDTSTGKANAKVQQYGISEKRGGQERTSCFDFSKGGQHFDY